MDMLITIGVIGVVVVIVALCAGILLAKFRLVPEADQALVVTGTTVTSTNKDGETFQRPKVVVGGGFTRIPILHKVRIVSLEVVQIPIQRKGKQAIPSKDRIPVELEGELTVQVDGKNEEQVILASQKLGVSDPEKMVVIVTNKANELVAAALRTAVFEFDYEQLNASKEEFEGRVQELLQKDLSRLGLTLSAVSIPYVTQGAFSQGEGDMFDAQGRRKVAAITEQAQTETNDIEQTQKIARQKRDLEAREQELALTYQTKQKEADQKRQVEEYEATQVAETRKAVLLQDQATKEAEATQDRAVQEAQIEEARKVEEKEIEKARQIAITTATAEADKAKAAAERREAEEEAKRREAVAEVAKNKAIETSRIDKEQAVKVADEQRQQAIETAEVERQRAVALVRAEEAVARAQQADAEAKQRASEEGIITVKQTAEADRQRQVVEIKANEEAAKETIAADRDAYVETKRAEAERDASLKRAEAVKARAEGEAEAARATAQGAADAETATAKGYAEVVTTKAQADFDAAEKQASARTKLAKALLEEGKAQAEAERLLVNAKNQLSMHLVLRDLGIKALEVAPHAIRELMAPVANVAHDVKILQVQGLGKEGESMGGLPATVLNTGLAAAGVTPFLKEAMSAISNNPDAQQLTGMLGTAVKGAIKEATGAVAEGIAAGSQAGKAE